MSSFVPKAAIGLAACAAMAVSIGIVCPAKAVRAAEPVVEYRERRRPPGLDKQNIYFDRGDAFGGTGEPVYWSLDWDSGTQGTLYENGGHFWWVLRASQGCQKRDRLAGHQGPPLRPFPRQGRQATQGRRGVPHAPASRTRSWSRRRSSSGAAVRSGRRSARSAGRTTIGGRRASSACRPPIAGSTKARWSSRSASAGTTRPSRARLTSIRSKWPRPTTARGSRPTSAGSGRWSRRAGSPTWAGPWKSFPARGPSSCTASGRHLDHRRRLPDQGRQRQDG